MVRPERRFYVRLARQFGFPDVDAMLAAIPSAQLNEWQALYALEPWGEELFYTFMSNAVSAICNSMGAKTKPADFLPECWKPKPATPLDFAGLMAVVKGR